jgi:2-polyprenyl-3-methyl-5-hydroxy-6-metoxy-1,4-benzoquinol methylase
VYERERALIDHYDENLMYYSPIRDGTIVKILKILKVTFQPGQKVIDIGCGTGWFCKWLLLQNIEAIGIDYSSKRIAEAYKNCFDLNESTFLPNFIQENLYDFLDRYEDPADYVTFWDVLEHLEEPRIAIELAKLTGKNILASMPVSMPYKAHLQVFRNIQDVINVLDPDSITKSDGPDRPYFFCQWKGGVC